MTIMLQFPTMGMEHLTKAELSELMLDISTGQHTGSTLAQWYDCTVSDLRAFIEKNRAELERLRSPAEPDAEAPPDEAQPLTPPGFEGLWITDKRERIKRLQDAADLLYKDIQGGALAGAELATAYREYRSYLTLVSNELGQLMHRGSGDVGSGESLSVEFVGVDMGNLK